MLKASKKLRKGLTRDKSPSKTQTKRKLKATVVEANDDPSLTESCWFGFSPGLRSGQLPALFTELFSALLGSASDSPVDFSCCKSLTGIRERVRMGDGSLLGEEGIFRLSGDVNVVGGSFERLKLTNIAIARAPLTIRGPKLVLFEQAVEEELSKLNVHEVVGLLKRVIRELPEPLLTTRLYNSFLAAANESSDPALVLNVAAWLPPGSLLLVASLCLIFQETARRNSENKMTSQSIARVFGPTLLRSRQSLTENDPPARSSSLKVEAQDLQNAHRALEILIDHADVLASLAELSLDCPAVMRAILDETAPPLSLDSGKLLRRVSDPPPLDDPIQRIILHQAVYFARGMLDSDVCLRGDESHVRSTPTSNQMELSVREHGVETALARIEAARDVESPSFSEASVVDTACVVVDLLLRGCGASSEIILANFESNRGVEARFELVECGLFLLEKICPRKGDDPHRHPRRNFVLAREEELEFKSVLEPTVSSSRKEQIGEDDGPEEMRLEEDGPSQRSPTPENSFPVLEEVEADDSSAISADDDGLRRRKSGIDVRNRRKLASQDDGGSNLVRVGTVSPKFLAKVAIGFCLSSLLSVWIWEAFLRVFFVTTP